VTKACSTWLSIGSLQPKLAAADESPGCLDASHHAVFAANAGDFAVLDEIDAEAIGGAGIAPGDGIMARRTATLLQQAAHDRKTGMIEIQERQHLLQGSAIQQLGRNAFHPHGVAAADIGVALAVIVVEIDDATLR
jgi:hypothetical protein